MRDRLEALSVAVGRPSDLILCQWAEIAAFVLEFRPDLIVEMGRGWGNSTCCFVEVANRLGGVSACRVVSLCRSNEWFGSTVPRLKQVVPQDWFAPADIRECNIPDVDPTQLLKGARRCLVFWDAHGFEVADWALSRLMPQLAGKPHLVLVHDVCDARYDRISQKYGEEGIWKGISGGPACFCVGHVVSNVPQAISIVDFTSRNHVPFHSAAESLHDEIGSDSARTAALKELLGDDLFSLRAWWFYFSLNEGSETLSFPRDTALKPSMEKIQEGLRNENTALKQSLEKIQSFIKTQEDYRQLATQKRELENLWVDVQNSAGWRLLNRWRELRNRVAAEGTLLRKLYDSVLRPVRDDSSLHGK
jgi:hypothetical protein